MCARGSAPHVARGWKTLQMHGFLYKHMGELQRAVTLILRRESKFPKVKSLVSTHSACSCKNYLPKCSPTPQTLINYINSFFSSYSVHTKQKKLSRKPHNTPRMHSRATQQANNLGSAVEPYKASKQPILQF